MTECGWCRSAVPLKISMYDLIHFMVKENQFCSQCVNNLVVLETEKTCPGCSKVQITSDFCQDCLMWKTVYPEYSGHHQALYGYNAFAKEIIERFKFTGDCETAELFKDDIKSYFKENRESTLIIPIPLSDSSFSSRGFNQTEVLLESAGTNYLPVLENRFQTEKQSKKNRRERLKTNQPFVVREEYTALLKGCNIILADDIYTTGRTIHHAIEVLRPYEPAAIKSFSLFR